MNIDFEIPETIWWNNPYFMLRKQDLLQTIEKFLIFIQKMEMEY